LDLDDLGKRHFRFVKIDAARLLDATRGPDAKFDMKRFKAALDRNGIDLIVERIETEETLVELLDFNIDLGQGFLFGEPRPAREDCSRSGLSSAACACHKARPWPCNTPRSRFCHRSYTDLRPSPIATTRSSSTCGAVSTIARRRIRTPSTRWSGYRPRASAFWS